MTRNPLPRRTATVLLTIELSAADTDESLQRLEGVMGFLLQRLGRTTFKRLAGMPRVVEIDVRLEK